MEIKRSSPVGGMHLFFHLHEISVSFSQNKCDFKLLHSLFLSRLRKIIKMPVLWTYSEDVRKIVENVYKFCVEEKQSGLKMSLERTWDQTSALTGVSRATAQRILSKKVELPSPSIDQAPTVTKMTLDC